MKRKISFGITLLLMLSLLLLALTACGEKECEHSYQSAVTKAATCESDGVMTYTCSLCTDSYTEVIKALEHDLKHTDAKAPTCTEIGWDAYVTCSRCDYSTYAEKAALTHDEIPHEAKTPTCTEIGWDAYVTCSRCDYSTYAEKPALDHDLKHIDAKVPTCTEIGWDTYACSRCTYTTYSETPALTHDEITHDAKAPTCTEIGWDAYVTCSRCDYSTYVEKAALTHDEIPHDAKAPTCTEIGWDAYNTCSRCDYTTYVETPVDMSLHYTENGYCKFCHLPESTPGLAYSLNSDGKTYTVTGIGTCSESNIVIGIYNNKSVISIGRQAFTNCSSLMNITIPDSVTSIGSNAFSSCPSLTIYCETDSRPSGWHSDWNYSSYPVVWNCQNNDVASDGYIHVVVDGLHYGIKDDAATVLRQPTSITAANISAEIEYKGSTYSVTSIGGYAFEDCSYLMSVAIPDSVIIIHDYAFRRCDSLMSIVIPDSVTFIVDMAFEYCSSLIIYCEETSAPSRWGSWWNYSNHPVVWDCQNNDVANNGYIYVIADGLRYGIKDGTATISRQPISITAANISTEIEYKGSRYSVTSISDYAFYGCSSLTSVVIPDNVTSIGSQAFAYCTSLTIYCEAASKPSRWSNSNRPVVWGYTGTNGVTVDGLKWGTTVNGVTIAGYTGSASNVVIPKTINGMLVTTISDYAFYGCSSLASIVIPTSVTCISSYAFSSCSSLASIVIPTSVTSIGSSAFSGCSSLASVVIPDSVTSIGERAFYNCSSLTSITIPDSVTSIGSSAFSYCSSLTSVVIPNSVTSIGGSAFSYCSSLTSVVIPNSVTSIGGAAFYKCSLLRSAMIPNSVTSIGDFAFYNCSLLTIYCEENPDSSGWASKWNYSSHSVMWGITSHGTTENELSWINRNNAITIIGYSGSATNVTIPGTINGMTVTSIGDHTFYKCSSLTSVVIPDSVTSIGSAAFSDCSLLTIYFEATSPPSWWNSNWNDSNRPVVWGYTGINGVTDDGFKWGTTASGVTISGYISGVTNVTIPETINGMAVTSIGDYAFYGCSSLTSMVIPDSVTSIGNYAFYGCSSLTSVAIPNSVTSIGDYAFYNCSKLIHATIPIGVTSIGDYTFYKCSSLTSVAIPNSVTSIGGSAFSNCSSLTSVVIPNSVTSIGGSAFSYCSSLASIVIPDNVTSIGEYIFHNCLALTSVKIGDGLTYISSYAFRNCDGLSSVVIPRSVISIASNAFLDCSNLTTVVIGDSVTSISSYAFSGCSSLASIVIPTSVTYISSYAFSGCSSLASIVIPTSVTSIGYRAFYNCSSLTIYCEATSKPSDWSDYDWNYSGCPVVWGYTGEEYTYDFVTNSGEVIESITTDRAFTFPAPTREGWCFGGWYDNEELSGNPVSSPYSSKTTHTLYAKWMTEEEYLASLDGSSFEKAYIITWGESLPAVIDIAGEYVYFKFTATESKTYKFQSSGSYDTYGYLYNSSKSLISMGDKNCNTTRYMYAGEVVYLKVSMYSSSSTGTFTISVS